MYPKANRAIPGFADLCFISHTPVEQIRKELQAKGVAVLEAGIVERTGATGKIVSVYLRAHLNLTEVSNCMTIIYKK